MILFYSGTGNSRYIAGRISESTGLPLFNVNERIKSEDTSPVNTGADIVLSVPTYGWRIPVIVEKWLTSVRLTGAERIWFVMSCGDSTGNADSYNKKLSERLGLEYMGTKSIVMPENYVAMFKVPKPSTALKIIAAAEPSIDAAAAAISSGSAFPAGRISVIDRILSTAINPVFYRLFVKAEKFSAGSDCIGCGKCAKDCPLNNITLTDGHPEWGHNCTHCMACICGCPQQAIEYGRSSLGKPRYINPYI